MIIKNSIQEDTMQGLLEAIEINEGILPIKEKEGMPAPTFVTQNCEEELIG